MMILATILSGLSLLLSILLIIRLKVINVIFMIRLAVAATSPYWAILGLVGALLGWGYGAPWAVLMGITSVGLVVWFVWRCARDHKGFEKAFGVDWKNQISPEQAKKMVKRRWSFYLKMKASPEPSFERDVVFWTVPDTDRELLCELLNVFISERDSMMADIRAAIQSRNSAELRRTAHAMKGALNHLGAAEVAQLAAALETSGATEQWDGTDETLARLEDTTKQLTTEYSAFTNNN